MSTQDRTEELLKQLSSLSPEKRALLALRLRKKGGEFNSFPLSFAQERLWFLDQLEQGNSAYNVPAALRLRGPLDVAALGRTLEEVVRRHEVLRTTFAVVDGKPVQVVAPDAETRLAVVSLEHLPDGEREAEARRLAEVEAQEPFDLARGPLLRTSLLRLGETEHVLLVTLHHIVSDGWSMSILVREVAQLYGAFARGLASPLKKLPIQYADFAVWQRGHLKGEVLEEHLAYWRGQLAGAPPVLELPTDRPRPAVQTFRGAKYQFKLPAELTKELKALSRREGATLYMTLLAAFQILLARYSGQEDVVVGSPIANRNRAETESLIGFFVNSVAMRATLSDNPAVTSLLARVREAALGAYAHQDLPFEKLVEELQPERDTSRAPIFQVMFALQNAPRAVLTLQDLTLSALGVENHTTHFDLGVSLSEEEDALSGLVEYNTDLFDAATIARLMRHYRRLLASVVETPTRPVSELQLLDPEELARLLDRWGATEAPGDAPATVLELFETQAARTPDAVAVVFGDERLTYAELNARAEHLARRLRDAAIAPEARVGVLLERSPELVVALFGIFKAGGAYVPLDPQYPAERLAFMLEDSRVAVLLTQSHLAERLPPGVAAQVITREWEDVERQNDAQTPGNAARDAQTRAKPDALAYLIYTSGTTGRPKAVMVEHRHLAHTLLTARRHFSFSSSDVMPVLASHAFDIWLFEAVSPLLAGGTSLVMRHEEVLDVARLVGELRRCRATLLHAVPSLMRQIVSHLRAEGEGATLPLRMVFVGGDAVGADLLREMRAAFSGTELRVLYGPTETAIICTAHEAADDERLRTSSRQLIGRPLAGVRIRIVDGRGQLVPAGVAGEIYIGGAGVSRGYLNRDDLTAEKFVEIEGERYYRSGDVGRWVLVGEDGVGSEEGDAEIEFLGRVDEQVKVRGFRVELGEVEAVVAAHARVREAAVVARNGGNGESRLIAYVVARSAEDGAVGEPSGEWARLVEELRRHARERLPEYMMPAQWVEMQELPLTAHGKVDKRRLPEAGDLRQHVSRPFVAPRTETEAALAEIWAKALRVERVGVNDNFFELGGDSILSIQTVARAREAGLHLTPKKLFQHQTVAELAAAIDDGAQGVESEQGIVTGAVALVPVQRRFLEEGRPNPHHFNMALMLESGEVLHPARMRKVVDKLLEHHDALRLRLVSDGGGWRQFIAGHDERPPFSYFDLSHLPEEESAAAIEAEATRLQQSLNLAEGPLVRVALFHVGAPRPDRLLIVVHHFAFDGVSWRILLEDLQTAYAQLARGEEIRLAPKTTSFKGWAAALGEYAKSEEVESELPFWSGGRRARVRPLPLDDPRGANTEASARTITVALGAEETRALLRDVPAAYRTQIGDVLLTALAQAFARWTGDDALLVEMEGHGRESIADDVDVSRTVGWFTSVYPAVVVLEEADGPGAALKSVKEQLRKIRKGGIGYGLLRYASDDTGAAERLAALRRPEVMFGYHGQSDQLFGGDAAFRPAAESAGPSRDAGGLRTHLVSVSGLVAGGRMRFDWTYSENMHRRETIERLADEFTSALGVLVAHCLSEGAGGFTPSDFPLAKLDQRRLDKLAGSSHAVEDIYRLSPMQQGLLFHTLHDPAAGLYVLQVSCTLGGGFDVEAFKTAWRRLIAENTTLRTAVVWKGYDEPLQVVYREAVLPWREEDWRGIAADEQRRRLASALDEDLRQSFELSRPPLMRLALRRLADDRFHLVWSFHHILLDGWSLALLLGQVFKSYASAARGDEGAHAPSRPYRDYIEWLGRQDLARAEEFWRRELRGFDAPTPLDFGAHGDGGPPPPTRDRYEKRELKLPAEVAARLQTLAQRHQLTLNTVVQGAWALLLSHYGGRDDIVFGAVVSGRPADLHGVENMLGIFINALPLRARPENQLALVSWLRSLQERNVELRQYEYSPLAEVQRWSEAPKGMPLFESVFVFENYPLDESLPELGGALGIRDAHFESQNNFPLTVHAHPRGAQLVLQFIYQSRRFDGAVMERVLGELAALLARMAERPETRLGELKREIFAHEKGAGVTEKSTRARATFKQFKSVKPKAVKVASASLVRASAVKEDEPLPLVVEPSVGGLDAAAWARDNLSYVNERLLKHGAILFRGFGLRTAEQFEQFVATITPDLFVENGEHPRRSISGSVYTPVAYPPDKQLLWHNENSFNQRWPMRIWFGCARPSGTGGETPLVDSRRVFEMLDPGIRRRFIEKKVMYVRNYEEGLGLNWQTVLRTTEKGEAEEICRRNLTEFEWKERGRLRTRSVRPAVVRHPHTGEWVWFNQAQHWHISCLDPAAREFVENNFREEDYPRHCYYGDGTPIEDSVMAEILEVYRQLEVSFPWQEGDAVVLDNLLTAHGRNAYTGERRLFVAMGEMRSYNEVETEAGESALTRGGAA